MEENKIPTAEDPVYFLQSYIEKLVNSSCKEIPYEGTEVDKSTLRTDILELLLQQRREYAKLHVKAALQAASENVKLTDESGDKYDEVIISINRVTRVNKDSILNAYPLEQIK